MEVSIPDWRIPRQTDYLMKVFSGNGFRACIKIRLGIWASTSKLKRRSLEMVAIGVIQ